MSKNNLPIVPQLLTRSLWGCYNSLLIDFVNGDAPMWRGYFYAFLLLVISVIQTLFASQYAHRINFVCLRIRTALVGVCYKKVS